MLARCAAWARQHALGAYFALAYALTWACELPLAAVQQGWVQYSIPFAIHYLGAFGPMLAALIITGITHGRQGIRELLAGLFKWHVGMRWIFFSLGAPILMFALAGLVLYATQGMWPDLALLGEVDYLPDLGIAGAFLLWLLTWGMGEEIGWRGFALPRLQRQHNALKATLILGMFHAFWHLPAFFYKDTYMAMGLVTGIPILVVSILAAAIVFTWIYNSTRGSLLMVVLFHALFDLLSVSQAGGSSAPAVMSAVVWILAIAIVIVFKPANLSRTAKQVA